MRCRRILVGLITAWVMLVCSCTSAPEKAAPGLIQKPTQAQGFYEPDPATYVMLMPSIREYFYNRKRAVVSGDMERFWQKYPQLKESMDLSRGINSESSLVHNMTDLKPVDGDIDIEHYERIAVKISQDHAEVLVHGLELYTWINPAGEFDGSGGEFKVVLFLQKDRGAWSVYKTDTVTMSEWR